MKKMHNFEFYLDAMAFIKKHGKGTLRKLSLRQWQVVL